MKIKKTLCCLLAILFVVGALGVNAMAVSVPYPIMIIDNDPVSSTGYSYSQSGFVYFTDGSLYNGDARKAGLSTSNYYNYTHPDKNLGKSFHVSVSAYLNHNDFRDPAARYYVLINDRKMYVGSIDQYNAPGGWSKIGDTGEVWSVTQYGKGVRVSPSGRRDYTGADGISIQYVMQ